MTTRGRSGPVVWTASAALLAAALASLAWVAWFVFFAGDGRKLDGSGSRAAAEVAASRGRDGAAAAALPAAVAATRIETTDHSAAEIRHELEAIGVTADQLAIVVFHAEADGKMRIVPNEARLTWATEKALARERELRMLGDENVDDGDLIEEIGERVVPATNGGSGDVPTNRFFSTIPRPAGPIVVVARNEASFALVRAEGDEPLLWIELSDDDAVRVQIVDARGRPQPGLVASFGVRGLELSDPSRRARADFPSAIATIRGVHAFARARHVVTDADWGVSVLVPSREPLFVPVDLAALPKEPIVVKLPPSGRMRFSFVGRDGQPVARPVHVRLLASPRRDREATPDVDGDLFEQRFVVTDGVLELPVVGCGLRFGVKYEFDGMGTVAESVCGPDAADELVETTCKLDFARLAFSGSLIRTSNERVVHQRITVRVLSNRGMDTHRFETPCVGEGETDAQGFFSIPIAVAQRESHFDCEVEIHSPTGPDRTLKAVAAVGYVTKAAEMGTLYLPGE